MRKYVYPCATGIAMAGAGAALALASSGTVQAAPVLGPPLSPVTSLESPTTGLQCLMTATGCGPTGSSTFVLTPNPPTPTALAAALFSPTGLNDPLYNLIGIGNFIPIVNIFVSNGANGTPGTGANGGNGGLLIGYGGAGGSGAAGQVGGSGGQGGFFFGSGGAGGAGGTGAAGGGGGNAGTLALFGHGGNGGGGGEGGAGGGGGGGERA